MPISYSLETGSSDFPYSDLPDVFANPPTSVSEMFRQLSFGELHDLKAGLDGAGNIKLERRDQVVMHANEGLRRLHLRFELISGWDVVTVPVSTAPLVVPFNVTAIQVVSMLTPQGVIIPFMTHPVPGELYVFNRRISFPPTGSEYRVQVVWQKRHPLLRYITSDSDLQQPIYLSAELWAALRAYIAGEMYGNMSTSDATAASGKYRNRYVQVCSEIQISGGTPQGMLDDQKFDKKGFV